MKNTRTCVLMIRPPQPSASSITRYTARIQRQVVLNTRAKQRSLRRPLNSPLSEVALMVEGENLDFHSLSGLRIGLSREYRMKYSMAHIA